MGELKKLARVLFIFIVCALVMNYVIVPVIQFLYYTFGPDDVTLAHKYKVPESKVFIEPKPHGCDFDDAPLGNKHCHYEMQVSPLRDCPDCRVSSAYVSWRKVEE